MAHRPFARRTLAALTIVMSLGVITLLAVLPPSAKSSDSATLTEGVAAWLDDNEPLRVGWSAALRPVSIVEDGLVTGGYAVDAWDLAALRLGIELEHVAYPGAEELGAALGNGDIDVIGATGRHPAIATGRQASQPYAWVPTIFVGLPDLASRGTDDLSGLTLTSLPGAAVIESVMQDHPGGTYVTTTSPREALQAVAAGDIDLFFGPLAFAGYQLRELGLEGDLVSIGEPDQLSTVQSWAQPDTPAADVSDVVRASLSDADLALLHLRYTGFDLTNPNRTNPVPGWVLAVAAAVAGLTVILGAFALLLRSQIRMRTTQLQTLNAELESLVRTRTSALQESNQALSRFASTAAHDIKGPLAAISSLAHLLSTRDLERDRQLRMLEGITASSERLVTLVDALLEDAVRLGSPGEQLTGQGFATWLAEVTAPEILVMDGDITVDVQAHELPIDADVLRRAVLNLVGNASKYAVNDGGTHIHVTVSDDPDSRHVMAVVADNGPGVPEQLRDKIFEHGTRYSDSDQGVGLGLSTIRALVQGAGGSIDVGASELGGAEFTVRLPYSQLPAADSRPQETHSGRSG